MKVVLMLLITAVAVAGRLWRKSCSCDDDSKYECFDCCRKLLNACALGTHDQLCDIFTEIDGMDILTEGILNLARAGILRSRSDYRPLLMHEKQGNLTIARSSKALDIGIVRRVGDDYAIKIASADSNWVLVVGEDIEFLSEQLWNANDPPKLVIVHGKPIASDLLPSANIRVLQVGQIPARKSGSCALLCDAMKKHPPLDEYVYVDVPCSSEVGLLRKLALTSNSE